MREKCVRNTWENAEKMREKNGGKAWENAWVFYDRTLLSQFSSFSSLDDTTVYAACDTANGINTCASRACAVESRFLRDVSMWSIFNFLDLATYSHNQGTFNATDTCHVTVGSPSPRSCCGTYPTRFPYRTLDGGHDCCVDKIFNTATTDCCADGTIGVVGTCVL